jgi:hypothetical protein
MMIQRGIAIEQLSPEAKTCLIKLGSQWVSNANEATGRYISNQFLRNVLNIKIPEWTQTTLKNLTGEGINAIKSKFIPNFVQTGILNKDDTGRFTMYSITQPGREVISYLAEYCSTCDDTKICTYCEDGIRQPLHICDHVLTRECNACNHEGMIICDECQGSGIVDNSTCSYCRSKTGYTKCRTCYNENECKYCFNDTRQKRCWSCKGSTECHRCK